MLIGQVFIAYLTRTKISLEKVWLACHVIHKLLNFRSSFFVHECCTPGGETRNGCIMVLATGELFKLASGACCNSHCGVVVEPINSNSEDNM